MQSLNASESPVNESTIPIREARNNFSRHIVVPFIPESTPIRHNSLCRRLCPTLPADTVPSPRHQMQIRCVQLGSNVRASSIRRLTPFTSSHQGQGARRVFVRGCTIYPHAEPSRRRINGRVPRLHEPVPAMTDDRHYDLSITIVPGITASPPRKLQLMANIDCSRRRNCPPPG